MFYLEGGAVLDMDKYIFSWQIWFILGVIWDKSCLAFW